MKAPTPPPPTWFKKNRKLLFASFLGLIALQFVASYLTEIKRPVTTTFTKDEIKRATDEYARKRLEKKLRLQKEATAEAMAEDAANLGKDLGPPPPMRIYINLVDGPTLVVQLKDSIEIAQAKAIAASLKDACLASGPAGNDCVNIISLDKALLAKVLTHPDKGTALMLEGTVAGQIPAEIVFACEPAATCRSGAARKLLLQPALSAGSALGDLIRIVWRPKDLERPLSIAATAKIEKVYFMSRRYR